MSGIVIIGGGAGGLELAVKLGRKLGPDRVLLVDRASLHIWKPALHEIAAGTLDGQREGLSYPVLAQRHGFRFMFGALDGINLENKTISLEAIGDNTRINVPPRAVRFEQLVLAVGSGSNLFDTPGAEHAFVLENTADAERFRGELLRAYLRAADTPPHVIRLAIVGAGATGIELAAELADAHTTMGQYLGGQPTKIEISVIESAPRILGGLSNKVVNETLSLLADRGIGVTTDTKVLEVSEAGLKTSRGEEPADIVVWAAGVKAVASNAKLGLVVNKLNQFVVNDRLETSEQGIFAMGDCASCPWIDGRTVPPRAQAAHQQADYLYKKLIDNQKGRRLPKAYVYKDYGSLVSVGRSGTVGNVEAAIVPKGFFVEGLMARTMYTSLRFAHQRSVVGLWRTVVLAMMGSLDRRLSGRIKLH